MICKSDRSYRNFGPVKSSICFVFIFHSFLKTTMAPSASKQKRLAEKAAKKNAAAAGSTVTGDDSPTNSTPAGSVNGASTPLTSMSGMNSKSGSQEDLLSMAKLNLATDRYVCDSVIYARSKLTNPFSKRRSAAGVLVSDVKGRDIKIDQYTLSFHGRLLIEGAEVALNYGQRYGLLGENGSGKVRLMPYVSVISPKAIVVTTL